MSLGHDTKVFIVANHAGAQFWLISAENQRDKNGRLVLQGQWGSPSQAKPTSLELATVYRRRFLEECAVTVHFTLSAGLRDYVEEPGSSSPSGEDQRAVMQYRGLLVRPGVDTRTGDRVWYCHLYEGTRQLESVRGSTAEEAVEKVFEWGQQDRAEKAPVQPQAQQAVPATKRPTSRIRPGDLR